MEQSSTEQSFAELMKVYRTRAGASQNSLARQVGVDPSYLNRLERAEREPPKRQLVEALADALALDGAEADQLLVTAGHLPRALVRLGPMDPTIRLVAEILGDEGIPVIERQEFRQIVALVARRWPAHAGSARELPTRRDNTY